MLESDTNDQRDLFFLSCGLISICACLVLLKILFSYEIPSMIFEATRDKLIQTQT